MCEYGLLLLGKMEQPELDGALVTIDLQNVSMSGTGREAKLLIQLLCTSNLRETSLEMSEIKWLTRPFFPPRSSLAMFMDACIGHEGVLPQLEMEKTFVR